MDCRKITPDTYGTFDAITCIGGMEHFCSIEEYRAGHQDKIYSDFFKNLYNLLPPGGRYYMQTMVFSKNMLPMEKISIDNKQDIDSYTLALMMKEFPGSWLPYGYGQVVKNAQPYFKLVSKSSGRLDYIETIKRWRKAFRKFHLKKYLLYASLIPKYLTSKEFRHQVAVFRISPNKVCFERDTMDHFRLVFMKI
jgi:cyclopropane-fatty-acyl-phospholipid synthase